MKDKHSWSVVIPWLLSIVTILVGIWQFSSQQGQSNRQPFLEKQLEIGFEATTAAATLASETDPVEWEKARKAFWRLYWGSLSIVEDRRVENAMAALGQIVPERPDPFAALPMEALQLPSLELAHAIRDLMISSWKIDLPDLQVEYQ